ncbi:MAG: cob(I)yrinic acid a,c-diamide adenosyltransferase [Hyphomonas sp.]|uniref:cob(I)yrinic acid a,c-diamide adenosyltransferase n=1 Tax=unclassified Hyphomonas TaxID=2630699 RepID=UPI000B66DC1E|nr:cob(I)yrinic acid a,c-diamide adenosyltransferase [Hyphomonas sp.]MAH92118.1 cob(I)yrinic acid a,c-diamide adenosyltransferase [Hyphomonas sp.]OUX89018.1 MAG: cob(I)yrinic acid a,c-diamide adenosyltransferase [Hyphomonas sp. TMED31]
MTDDTSHTEKMKALQEEQRKKTDAASVPDRGLVLVHTGNGKGKSSSAFGVIARALGWDQKVGVVQFIKGKWITGERQFFSKFPDQLDWHTMGEGFTWDTQDKARDIAAAEAAFARAKDMMASGKYDLVVLDEINIAMRYDYLAVDAVLDGLKARSGQTSVILTGRDAKPALCDYADLVSEMVEIKHPFKAGLKAKRGVDF